MAVGVYSPPPTVAELITPLPTGSSVVLNPDTPTDLNLIFAKDRKSLRTELDNVLPEMLRTATLWLAWPKKASGYDTNLTEDTLREILLPFGLVDIKVCAIDNFWSGLKFVYRKENR